MKFRIVTYNVLEGFGDAEVGRFLPGAERRAEAYRWLASVDSDVIAFQELNGYGVDRLESDAIQWGHRHVALLTEIPCSIGITSRWPLEVRERHHESMHHGLLDCIVSPDNASPVRVIATHLWPYSGDDRLQEITRVLDRIGSSSDTPVRTILLGDFNAFSPLDRGRFTAELLDRYRGWNWEWIDGEPSFAVIQSILDSGLVDLYDSMATGRDMLPHDRVDYIFASNDLASECRSVRWLAEEWKGAPKKGKLSDHFPLVADIDI